MDKARGYETGSSRQMVYPDRAYVQEVRNSEDWRFSPTMATFEIIVLTTFDSPLHSRAMCIENTQAVQNLMWTPLHYNAMN